MILTILFLAVIIVGVSAVFLYLGADIAEAYEKQNALDEKLKNWENEK
jgi:hypothetical protein